MSNTQNKLKEAKFFLDQFELQYLRGDFEKLNHFLNAFISSSRSVIWVMKNEFNNVPGWKEWYKNYEATGSEIKFLGFINELRIETTKRKSLSTRLRVVVDFPISKNQKISTLKKSAEKFADVTLSFIDGSNQKSERQVKIKKGESMNFKGGKIHKVYFSIYGYNQDALLLSKKYYKWLEKVVLECEKRFSLKLRKI